jgi:hypothetical protein
MFLERGYLKREGFGQPHPSHDIFHPASLTLRTPSRHEIHVFTTPTDILYYDVDKLLIKIIKGGPTYTKFRRASNRQLRLTP